jgi:hypothetical protein
MIQCDRSIAEIVDNSGRCMIEDSITKQRFGGLSISIVTI